MPRISLGLCALTLALAACSGEFGALDMQDGSSTAQDAATEERPLGGRARVRTQGAPLNLRASDNGEAEVLASIPNGCLVDVLSEAENDYLQVRYGELPGFSHRDYLEAAEDDALDCGVTGEGSLFLLPWPAGQSFRVSNAHDTNTHTGKDHWAWDFATPVGTTILAAHDGIVRRIKSDSTRGGCNSAFANDANYVVLERGDGLETLYMHLDTVSVKAGQAVEQGTPVGTSGASGWACGAHLHYQVQQGPSGGGTTSWWNQSVRAHFYDTGEAYDPPEGSSPVSENVPK